MFRGFFILLSRSSESSLFYEQPVKKQRKYTLIGKRFPDERFRTGKIVFNRFLCDVQLHRNLFIRRGNFLTLSVGFTDPNWADYGYDLSPLLREIRRERRVELVSEEFRWDDIVRWKAGELLEKTKTLAGIRVPPEWKAQLPVTLFQDRIFTTNYLLQTYSTASRNWNDKLYLRWIPVQEITLNSNLVQNPGW